MGSAASISSLRDHSQEEVINRCAILYANDPMFFEYVVAEAKKKATQEHSTGTKSPSSKESKAEQPAAGGSSGKEGPKPTSVVSGSGNSIDLLSVINRVRMQPSDFIPALEKHLAKFVDENVFQLKTEGKTINIRTIEGKAAVAEAVEFLKTALAVDPIKYSPLLEKAALDHVRDIHTNCVSGHEVCIA
jgi:hypothetical protein